VPPEPGLSALVEITVTDADTAIAMRSGSVPVLATPRVIALVEEACVQAINGSLAPGQTSVGMQVQLDHVNPTLVGGTAIAEATLDKCNGRRLSFTVSVSDGRGLIAAGRVTRVVVDEQRFLEKAAGS
jgi:predicted thioesterase